MAGTDEVAATDGSFDRRRRSMYVLIAAILIAAVPVLVLATWAGANATLAHGTAYRGADELVSHPFALFWAEWSHGWWFFAAGAAFGFAFGAVVGAVTQVTRRPRTRWDWPALALSAIFCALVSSAALAAFTSMIWIQYR